MKTLGAIVGSIVLGVVAVIAVVALAWGIQLAYLHFVEGPSITQHAQNVRHGLNFTQAENQKAENAIAEYQADAGDATHQNADRLTVCTAASTITTDEQNSDVQAFVLAHCGQG